MVIRSVIRLTLGLLLVVSSLAAVATVETFDFDKEENRKQYQTLTEILRCPKCQNQNIADSNAPIAQDMRKEVYRLVQEGKGQDDVVDFMVDRFGDFVVYEPKMDTSTIVLWFGPLVMGVVGILVVIMMARKSRQSSAPELKTENDFSQEEKAKLKNLLND